MQNPVPFRERTTAHRLFQDKNLINLAQDAENEREDICQEMTTALSKLHAAGGPSMVSAHVPSFGGEVILSDLDGFRAFHEFTIRNTEERLLRDLNQLQREEFRTFAEFMRRAPGLDQKRIDALVTYNAWNSVKGKYWEWAIGASLLYGQRQTLTGKRPLVFRKDVPIALELGERQRWLWYQPRLKTRSGFTITADFLLTEDSTHPASLSPTDSKIVALIECKAVKDLNADQVWKLVGQIQDLALDYAVLAPYYPLKDEELYIDRASALNILVTPSARTLLNRHSGVRQMLKKLRQIIEVVAIESRGRTQRDIAARQHRYERRHSS